MFVAWIVYASEGTYSLEEVREGGEMPHGYCWRTETAGAGTAELVLCPAHRVRADTHSLLFDLSGARLSLDNEIALAARGDTLLVVADLAGPPRAPVRE